MKSGLYVCTQCGWFFVKSGKQWFGAVWPEKDSRMIGGHLSRIHLDEYGDCVRNLERLR